MARQGRVECDFERRSRETLRRRRRHDRADTRLFPATRGARFGIIFVFVVFLILGFLFLFGFFVLAIGIVAGVILFIFVGRVFVLLVFDLFRLRADARKRR